MEKYQLTKEGVSKLEAEYRHLLDVVRPQNTKDIVDARALGDLSENADYDAARDAQARTEGRIQEIENILNNYELIKESSSTKLVKIGCVVVVKDLTFDEEDRYEIVGSIEADPMQNKLSSESPLASAILGHKVGDVVEVNAPTPYSVEIVSIERH
jgi:transcription elongation factor GreA